MTAAVHDMLKAKATPQPPEPWPPGLSGSVADLIGTPAPDVHWFAHFALLAYRAHLLTGAGGSSKTRLLYHLAVGAILGRLPWGWKIERTGSAVLFLAEDTVDNVHRTLHALIEFGDITESEAKLIGERLFVFPLAGKDAVLLANDSGSLRETVAAEGMRARCKTIPGLAFIGVDPCIAFSEGNEMDAAHQRRLGELFDRLAIETRACVVATSHAAKHIQNAEEVGSHSSRGSGAITDAVRAEFTMRTMTADEGRKHGITEIEHRRAFVQLAATKGNELPPSAFAPIWLKRGPGGVLEVADLAAPAADPVGPRERAALDVLRRLATTSTPLLKDWRDACAAEGLLTGKNPEAMKKAMDRIRETLMYAGLVRPGMAKGAYVPAEDEA
jgi:hypothetical protein